MTPTLQIALFSKFQLVLRNFMTFPMVLNLYDTLYDPQTKKLRSFQILTSIPRFHDFSDGFDPI